MKKKILSLISVIALLAMLVTFTGCGNNSEEVQQNGETNGEQNNGEVVTSNGQKISTIVQAPDEDTGEAVIKLGDDYSKSYVVNSSGEIVYTIDNQYMGYTYKNGYVYNTQEVVDLSTGEAILTADANTEIKGITKSCFILERVKKEELGGTKYETKVVDKTGKSVWSEEQDRSSLEYFKAVGGDLVVYLPNTFSNVNYTLIDPRTGKTADLGWHSVAGYFQCERQGDYLLVGISANNDKYKVVNVNTGNVTDTGLSHVKVIFNDKYVYARPLWGTVGIYSMDGKLVKDLTEGSVEKIAYLNNKYYVQSETGFYYTLNENFEYVTNPIKINDTLYSDIEIRPYGIEFTANGQKYYINEADFKPDTDMTSTATLLEGTLSNTTGESAFLTAGSEIKLVNLKTLEEIQIHNK